MKPILESTLRSFCDPIRSAIAWSTTASSTWGLISNWVTAMWMLMLVTANWMQQFFHLFLLSVQRTVRPSFLLFNAEWSDGLPGQFSTWLIYLHVMELAIHVQLFSRCQYLTYYCTQITVLFHAYCNLVAWDMLNPTSLYPASMFTRGKNYHFAKQSKSFNKSIILIF